MSTPSRIEVNAAIEKLIAREAERIEVAKIVVLYGDGLKKSKVFQLEFPGTDTSGTDSFSGYTSELGQVDLRDSQGNKSIDRSWGKHESRIGYFRLRKEREGLLIFHHFWKSSITTKSANGTRPDEYFLYYNPNTLEPVCFGVKRQEVVFRMCNFMIISRLFLEPIYGTPKKPTLGWDVLFPVL